MKHPSPLVLLLFLAIACLLSSCAGGFDRRWRGAEDVRGRTGIEGRWDGTWRSHVNGHHGRLRCIVSPTEQPGVYQFHYGGTFARILGFQYTVDYAVQRRRGTWTMKGESDLGWMGGAYSHEATVKDGEFKATYRSARDHGVFAMRRVVQ